MAKYPFHVVTIGLGDEVDTDGLYQVASHENYSLNFHTVDELQDAVQYVAMALCEIIEVTG